MHTVFQRLNENYAILEDEFNNDVAILENGTARFKIVESATITSETENTDLVIDAKGFGFPKLNKNLNANAKQITNLAAPTSEGDATRRKYVDDGLALKVNTSSLSTLTATLAVGAQPGITSLGTQTAALNMGTNKITSLGTPTLDADASTKKYVDDGLALKVNTSSLSTLAATLSTAAQPGITSLGTQAAALNMGTNKITSLGTPTLDADASTKKYVDDGLALKVNTSSLSSLAATLSTAAQPGITSLGTQAVALNMGTNKITSLGTPTVDADASTKKYVDDGLALKVNISSLSSLAATLSTAAQPGITSLGTQTAALNMGTNKITSLGTPTLDFDASTKKYVDDGLALKVNTSSLSSLAATLSTAAQPGITSLGTQAAALNMGTNKITSLGTPTLDADASTKKYVDDGLALKVNTSSLSSLAATLSTAAQPGITSLGTQTAALNMGSNNITLVNSISMDNATFSNITASKNLFLQSGNSAGITLSAPFGSIDLIASTNIGVQSSLNMTNNKITSLGTPTLDFDASTKKYTDDGLALKVNTSSLSSLAATLSTAAQPGITSLGTLTGLTINGTITTAAGANLTLTPSGAGQLIVDSPSLFNNGITMAAGYSAAFPGITISNNTSINSGTISTSGVSVNLILQPDGSNIVCKKPVDCEANLVLSTATPTSSSHLTNKSYVDTQRDTRLALSGGTMTGAIAMGNNNVSGVSTLTTTTLTATTINTPATNTNLTISPNGNGLTLCKSLRRVWAEIDGGAVVYFTQNVDLDVMSMTVSSSYVGDFTLTSSKTFKVATSTDYCVSITAHFLDSTNERSCELGMFENGTQIDAVYTALPYLDSGTSYVNAAGTFMFFLNSANSYTFRFKSIGGGTADLTGLNVVVERV